MPKKKDMRPCKEVDTSTYSGRFAVRLRTLRKKAGMSPQQVADALEITLGTIYHWETAHSFPKPDQLPILAEVLELKGIRTLFPEK